MFAATRAGVMAGRQSAVPGYRYWRIYVTASYSNGTAVLIEEIEARLTLGGATATTPTTPMYASYQDSPSPIGGSATGAVDNSTSGYWSASANGPPWWIEMDLGAPVNVAQIAIRRYNNSLGFAAAPRVFKIQKSNDRVSYVDAASITVADWNPTQLTFTL